MEKLKKSRAPLRAAFTKQHNELTTELAKPTPDIKTLQLSLAKLEDKLAKVSLIDKQILTAMLNEEAVTDDDYNKESDSIDEYGDKIIECRVFVDHIVNPLVNSRVPLRGGQTLSNGEDHQGTSKNKFRLPKLEIHKFDGDLKNWLCFWSLFKKVHEDEALDPEDKFQYLLQAITPGSRAHDMLVSYPPTAENYPKVIDSLKKRFGRDDLLVEVYVRELLTLVLQNAVSTKEKIGIATLFDKLDSHMRALETLGVTNEKCASMLYPLVESSLPEDVLRAWQRSFSSADGDEKKNRLLLLMEFLRSEVEGEERIKLSRKGFGLSSDGANKQTKKKECQDSIPTATGLFSGDGQSHNKVNCIFCDKRHLSYECFKAQKMNLNEKTSQLKKRSAWFCCLQAGHRFRECKKNVKCIICAKNHLSLMCPDLPQNKEKKEEDKKDNSQSNSVGMANVSCSAEVGLQTLIIKVRGKSDREVRAIFDSASQRSYILKRTAEATGQEIKGEEKLIHSLFGGAQSLQQTHCRYEVRMTNISNDYECKFELLDQTRICHEIPRMKKGAWENELSTYGVKLSDVGAGSPEIEILIGADIMGQLLTGKIIQLKSGMTAIETKLGWTLLGKISEGVPTRNSCLLVTTLLAAGESNVSDLWRLETIGITDSGESKSREEMETAAKQHFLDTVKLDDSGRYEVHLPWVDGHPNLPTNRVIAEKRLMSTTKKLCYENRMETYENVFREWLQEGIIEVATESELGENVHFLPHRAVIKENSGTTKVRPVFDASAKEKNRPSLNDCLEKGPNLIELIPATVTRFRMKRIGVISDIRKAFLQVGISRKDCDSLLFLWWENYEKRKMLIYRHRRAVFGATCSPFLLASVLEYHLTRVSPGLMSTANKLLESFYVDNCVTSVSNEIELYQFVRESKEIMTRGKFELLGWEHSGVDGDGTSNRVTPLLGMLWDKRGDSLYCDVKGLSNLLEEPITKRKLLSVAHKIFDIVGFSSSVTLAPKLLLQGTWKLKVGWDAELPKDISDSFRRWAKDLHRLGEIKVPRWFGGADCLTEKWTLHMFCDASKLAYAAAVFLRIETDSGVVIQLVQAKARVAPIDKLTIPRLELLSCLIGCRLTEMVKTSMRLNDVPTYYWTDSSTALHWIQNEDLWATFVGNRVKEIRSLSKIEDWRHVRGALNPADLPSRGCSVKQLIESEWWEGPSWLKGAPESWMSSNVTCDVAEVNRERKKTVSSLHVGVSKTNEFLQRSSNFTRVMRVIAWMTRWGRKKIVKASGELTVLELENAEQILLKLVQSETFVSENDDKLKTLAVFRDEDGLLKVKTNITMRDDQRNFKFPILLPADHPMVHMMIRDHHLQNSHMGVQSLLTLLRENYWIIRGRKTVRSVLLKCNRCRRYEAKKLTSVPVPLPKDRVRDSDVFEITGVDLAGPLYLKGNEKTWIVLYTCAVYRAVHLELVTSISTDSFLQSFRRFIARRGRPAIMYSDNGTNFEGADNMFSKVNWSAVEVYSSVRRIQWKFNPPTAAWWGGWWERIVGLIKKLLRRILGKASLNYETLNTVLCDCESVINSRPLTYVSEDIMDLAPLTPSAFLQERRKIGVPDVDAVDRSSLNRAFRRRQHLIDQLRQRFRVEYLGQLVQKSQSQKENREIEIGDIVLVGSDNVKRLDWPLAKIINIYPGKDGNVRVVRVKTTKGELVRPIQRIYPLEISAKHDQVFRMQEVEPPKIVEEPEAEKVPLKILRTRSGKEIKVPVKFNASFSSFVLLDV